MTNASAPVTPRPKRRWHLWEFLALALVALALGVFALGIYHWNWRGPATKLVAQVVPYPAAIVDGSVILWSDYQDNVSALERFYQLQQARTVPGSDMPSVAEIQQRVLDRLIRDRLAEEAATGYGITVSPEDVAKAYNQGLAVSMGPTKSTAELQVEATLKDTYGLSSAEYREKMLRPFLIRQALQAKIAQDPKLNAGKLQKVTDAANALKAGADFKTTALKYSEDSNVNTTFGDRGLIGPGLFPAEVDAALKQAQTGDVLGPIKTSLGYHVLKVGDIKVVNGVRKVAIQEILVHPIQLDDWLEARVKSASVISFVGQ